MTARFITSSTDVKDCLRHSKPEYAFIGRSNVGKSSLINALCHDPKLAKTSQKPGKTLLINQFLVDDDWYLVDLPGYGYARASKEQLAKLKTMIERYCLYREQLTSLFVLIDVRLEPQKVDMDFISFLGENGISFALVFTKADKLGTGRLKMNVNDYKHKLLEQWEELPPCFVTSAETGMGTEEVLNYINEINKSL